MQTTILLVLSLALPATVADVFREKVGGVVGAGNYTYYTLFFQGGVLLRLRSLSGDADLYVGPRQPTYEVEGHILQSATCGLDEVRVKFGNRTERLDQIKGLQLLVAEGTVQPLMVGVYGHPSHEESSYELEMSVEDSASVASPPVDKHPAEEFSLLWNILFGILKVLLEVIDNIS